MAAVVPSSLETPTPRYRRMTSADLSNAHRLSQAVRWPHRLEDWQFVAALGTGFVAEADGELIGTALCWGFGEKHGALGLVIVAPDAQGRGIGRELMTRVLAVLGDRVTFLHATPAGQPLYEKLGFVACGSVTQHQAVVGEIAAIAPLPGDILRQGHAADMPQLIALVRRSSGIDHHHTLPALQDVAETLVLERDGALVGCAFFRRFGRGHVIGPVFAERDDAARSAKVLISYWLARHAGDFLRIDSAGNAVLSEWLEACGLPAVDTGVKMVRNAGPDEPSVVGNTDYATYAILNQAMG